MNAIKWLMALLAPLAMLAYANQSYAQTSIQTHIQTYVIETYGDPNELVPVIQSTLPNRPITSYQDKLIIQATPSEYAQVRSLLTQIDSTPASITLSLKADTYATDSRAGGQVNVGIHRKVWVNGTYQTTQSTSTQHQSYSVRGVVGKPLFIGKHTLLNLISSHTIQQGAWQWRFNQSSWLTLTEGISATVRSLPNGQYSITLWQGLANQILSTTITAYQGQWVPIGELQHSQNTNSSYTAHYQSASTPIYLKIDKF